MANPRSSSSSKRAGDDFTSIHEKVGNNKKPRFDQRNPSTLVADARDEEEELILNADVIGRPKEARVKRNAVKIDGYDSDSDNDNFNARAEERERRKRKDEQPESKDEEDNDMFADLEEDVQGTADGDEDEDLAREGKKKKKDVRFLDQTEIEGQVMSSTSGGHVSSEILMGKKGKQKAEEHGSESEESSGTEDERDQLPEEMEDDLAAEIGAGGKKKHAPRLDAFNLQQEVEEGQYDESGNYVRKAADPDADNDTWLDGLSKKDMKRAKEAQEKRDEERRQQALAEEAVLTSELLSTLIQHLETGETTLEALQRLQQGMAREKKVPKWKLKKQKNSMDVDDPEANNRDQTVDTETKKRKQIAEAMGGAANILYSRGNHDIYQTERELLMRLYHRETDEDWQPPSNGNGAADDGSLSAMWEYRWSDARDGGEPHGPYDVPTIKAWNDAGYFGEGVEFRRYGEIEWSKILDTR